MNAQGAQITSAASSLPLELLGIIFSYLYTSKRRHWQGRRSPPLDIVSPSQVCRRWRAASLSSQLLWSGWFPLRSLEWTRVCLERCRSPLKFNVLLDGLLIALNVEYRHAARLVYPHMARARILNMPMEIPSTINPDNILMYELKTGLSRMPAPNLTKLMVGHHGERPYHRSSLTHMFCLDICLGKQRTPRLQELSLTQICVYPYILRELFSASLRSLSLINCHAWRNVDEMIATLQATPMLESFRHFLGAPFRWQDKRFMPSRSKTHALRCVRLPYLKSLFLHGDSVFAINMTIFSHLDFPSTATLSLLDDPNSRGVLMEDIEDFIQMGWISLREHFASAIAHGASFNSMALDDLVLSAPTTRNVASLFEEVETSEPAQNYLPDAFEFVMPEIEGEASPTQFRPGHDRLLDMVLGLPIFGGVKCLTVLTNFESYDVDFFERLPDIATLFFNVEDPFNWTLFSELLRSAIENGEEWLPKLKRIILPCPRDDEGYGGVEHFDLFAETIATHWEDSFEAFVIAHYRSDWKDRDAVLDVLVDKLGYHRVWCLPAEDVNAFEAESDYCVSGDDSDSVNGGDE